jgi:hypothetical protein
LGCPEGGHEANCDSGEESKCQGECQNPSIYRNLLQPGQDAGRA